MKKILSMILTLTMFISVLYPCQSVIAEEVGKENAIAVGNEVAEMCAEYDDSYDNIVDSDVPEDKIIGTRLIVKTNDTIDEYGAVDSVYGLGYAFLQYADEKSASSAMQKYSEQGYMVEYDAVITSQADESTDTDTEINSNWAYEETDSTTVLDYYKYKIKPEINVAVVDSGINYNHELFKNRVVRTNTNFSSDIIKNDEIDNDGHGTMVAGVIAKSTPDNVKIHAYKVSDGNSSGTSAMFISAISYISELSKKPDIINLSISVLPNEILEEELNNLINEGITIVAAAGNATKEAFMTPERMENVITVAATDRKGQPCYFSNYGVEVDISAPGEYIYTSTKERTTSYSLVDGTSFSSPLVASAAAIVLMENRNYTPEQVKEKLITTAIPFKRGDCNNLYGAGIVNFSNLLNSTRCKDVTANHQGGIYRDDISVELKCANTLVDIYYTTDGSLPTKTNGTKYTAPINVNKSERIIAAAFARAGTPLHSKYTSLDYYILKNGEDEYVIDDDGTILNYLGSETTLTVPEKINGIVPTTISKKCFQYKNIKSIVLPDSVKLIDEYSFKGTGLESITANGAEMLSKYCFESSELQGVDFPNVIKEYYAFNNTPIVSASLPMLDYAQSGFYNCNKLSSIYIPNLRSMDEEVFYGCSSLTQDLELPKLEAIGHKAFANSYFKSIRLPICSKITETNTFEGAAAEDIVIGKVNSLPQYAFYNCPNLKNVYLPKIEGIFETSFLHCDNIEMIFAPMARHIQAFIPNNVTMYVGEYCWQIGYCEKYAEGQYTFVAPENSPLIYTVESDGKISYTHINSDQMVNSKGRSIRVNNPGLRFGFDWDKITQLEKFAENIEYGFIYHYNYDNESFDSNKLTINNANAGRDNVKLKKAVNLDNNGDNTNFNLVFTNIPKEQQNTNVSARAYVCIDGMYFYSNVLNGSFRGVADLVLADNQIDQATKDRIQNLINGEV